MLRPQIALGDEPTTKARIAALAYYPGKLPRPWPHGHVNHTKCDEYCAWPIHTKPVPDFPIRTEKIGGGAAPEGYGAFVWPDELHTVALMGRDTSLPGWTKPVEGWTEEDCFAEAIQALEDNVSHRLNEPWLLDFPPYAFDAKFWVLIEPYQRAELLHDIDDCCLAIDTGLVFPN